MRHEAARRYLTHQINVNKNLYNAMEKVLRVIPCAEFEFDYDLCCIVVTGGADISDVSSLPYRWSTSSLDNNLFLADDKEGLIACTVKPSAVPEFKKVMLVK